MPETTPDAERRWLEGLDERTERERMEVALTVEERDLLGQRLMLAMTCNHGLDYFGSGAVCETCFANVQRIGRIIERTVAAERAEWAGRVEALAAECGSSSCIHLNDLYGRLRALAQPAATEPGTAGERAGDLASEPHAYFGYVCSGFGAPLICVICKRDMFDPIHDEDPASPSAVAAPSVPTEDSAAKEGEQ